jgi:hypothetical protein
VTSLDWKVNDLQRRVNDLEQALASLQKAQEQRYRVRPGLPKILPKEGGMVLQPLNTAPWLTDGDVP